MKREYRIIGSANGWDVESRLGSALWTREGTFGTQWSASRAASRLALLPEPAQTDPVE